VISAIGRITSSPNSHTFGWARTWSENLGNIPINHLCEPAETVFVDHGINFNESLNFFGGFSEQHEQYLVNLSQAKKVWTLDIEMPPHLDQLLSRKDFNVSRGLLRDFSKFCLKARKNTLRSTDLGLDWLTIGDSHSAAWAPQNSMVVRANGKTLNGQIQSNFSYVREHLALCPQIRGLTLCFGNIDIRHHLCRISGADWRAMWRAYREFGDSLPIEVEYAVPWPIEFEGRKLPQTGYYKGQPFWGSQRERAQLLEEIISFCDDTDMNIIRYPDEWRRLDPEFYAKNFMEKPQSVHLSPAKYRRQNWGITN